MAMPVHLKGGTASTEYFQLCNTECAIVGYLWAMKGRPEQSQLPWAKCTNLWSRTGQWGLALASNGSSSRRVFAGWRQIHSTSLAIWSHLWGSLSSQLALSCPRGKLSANSRCRRSRSDSTRWTLCSPLWRLRGHWTSLPPPLPNPCQSEALWSHSPPAIAPP